MLLNVADNFSLRGRVQLDDRVRDDFRDESNLKFPRHRQVANGLGLFVFTEAVGEVVVDDAQRFEKHHYSTWVVSEEVGRAQSLANFLAASSVINLDERFVGLHLMRLLEVLCCP